MERERREHLRAHYLRLGWGEVSAAIVFTGVAAWVVPDTLGRDSMPAIWWAVAPLVVILLQAGAYWLVARRWVGIGLMPRGMAHMYRGLRVVDAALIVVAATMAAWWWPVQTADALIVVAIVAFAAVEFTNYFVARLAYRRHWWSRVREWRRPQLMRDVSEALASP